MIKNNYSSILKELVYNKSKRELEKVIKEMEYRRWTQEAINCFNRGCVCSGCIIKNIMQTQCKMKQTVIELVKRHGVPQTNKIKGPVIGP